MAFPGKGQTVAELLPPGEKVMAIDGNFGRKLLSAARLAELDQIVEQLLSPGKGLMIIEDNLEKLMKTLQCAELPPTCLTQLRLLLYEVPEMQKYIGGVAFTEDGAHQEFTQHSLKDRFLMREFVVGIKYEPKFVKLCGITDEYFSQGLDGVFRSISYYYHCGFRFFEWRCVLTITETTPTKRCINVNANALACFASLCQKEGAVPVLQTEVSRNGTHSLVRCEKVTELFLAALMEALANYYVYMKGVILKLHIVTCGKECHEMCDSKITAKSTLIALRRSIPPGIPGIAFSSKILGRDDFYILKIMNSMSRPVPWILTFSFEDILSTEAIRVWSRNPTSTHAPQIQFVKTLEKISMSSRRSMQVMIDEDEIKIPEDN